MRERLYHWPLCSMCGTEHHPGSACPLSSPPQPTSTPTNPISPNQLFDHAGKLAVLHSLAESLLSRIGTLASEFSRLAQTETRGCTDGQADTTDTPSVRRSLASIALANTDLPLVRTSPPSIQEGVKAARMRDASLLPSNLAAQMAEEFPNTWGKGSAQRMAAQKKRKKHSRKSPNRSSGTPKRSSSKAKTPKVSRSSKRS